MSIASPNGISSQIVGSARATGPASTTSQAQAFNDVAASLRHNGVAAPSAAAPDTGKANTLDDVLNRIGATQNSEVGQGASKTYASLLSWLGSGTSATV